MTINNLFNGGNITREDHEIRIQFVRVLPIIYDVKPKKRAPEVRTTTGTGDTWIQFYDESNKGDYYDLANNYLVNMIFRQ